MGSRTRSAACRTAPLTGALAALTLAVAACQDPAPPEPLGPPGDLPLSTSATRTSDDGPTSCPRSGGWTLTDPRITESSGIARSHVHPGVLYTHNDRGRTPSLFALDASGTRAVLQVAVPALDWEDLASTPDGRLWVADTGDNDLVRDAVQVIVLEEPDQLASTTVPSTTYALRYPDGPHDAEALLVNPRDDRLWIVTKDTPVGRVYVAPAGLDEDAVNALTYVGQAPPAVTAGDFSPDGDLLVLRNQANAYFSRGFRSAMTRVDLPQQRQGESVTFTADGRHVLVGSEGEDSTLRCVAVPPDVER